MSSFAATLVSGTIPSALSSRTARRMNARSVNRRERACTKPARCAASWTESAKTSVFFSPSSSSGMLKRLDSATDSNVATDEPR